MGEPFGIVPVNLPQAAYRYQYGCLVADRQNHVIRLVSPDGEVSTPWGHPGQAGHQDARPSSLRRLASFLHLDGLLEAPRHQSLFNGPTFLSPSQLNPLSRDRAWKRCLVSDSGNHVIRALYPDGTSATLAGTAGEAGYRDAACATEALFNNPQGLVEDPQGNVYIADQGNHVIRCLTARGEVRTLAGCPGVPGHQDGLGAAARFTELRGLALQGPDLPMLNVLYASDGHAIRKLYLPLGLVTTPLGVVGTPGYKEVVEAGDPDPSHRREELHGPCLNRPCGLFADGFGLKIADQGNHSVRNWSPSNFTLTTLAGDPSLPATRWGLIRDGLALPLDERYACVEAPRVVAGTDWGCYYVSTGSVLAGISPAKDFRDRLHPLRLQCASASASEACVVSFTVEPRDPSIFRPCFYSVDFIEADGTLAERRTGEGSTSLPVSVQGQFAQRGLATLVVRCVTDQGVSVGARTRIEVQ